MLLEASLEPSAAPSGAAQVGRSGGILFPRQGFRPGLNSAAHCAGCRKRACLPCGAETDSVALDKREKIG
jgi:hypothetical protein